MTRIAEPQLSFADLELRNQGVHLDPLLQGIVGFLVPQELRRAYPGRGRYSRRQSPLVVLATDPSGKRPRRSESRSDPVFAPV
jgi:hypothetical protein